MAKEGMVFIYILIDPITDQVRYVGKTIDPKKRFQQHLCRAKEFISHCQRWIQSLLDQDLKPIMQIVEKTTRAQWRERECYWICYFQNLNAPLTNLTEGGQGWGGMHHTPETREKIRQARHGMKFSKEHRIALRKNKNQFYNTSQGKKVIESLSRRYAILTDEQVAEVYLLAYQGISQKQIAKKYQIPQSSVSEIKSNQRYKHVKRPPLPLIDQE